MEILQLTLCLTQQDIDQAICKWMPHDGGLKNLSVTIDTGGLEVSGKHGLFTITIWLSVTVSNGNPSIKIQRIKTPLGLGNSKVLETIQDALTGKPCIRMQGETIDIELDALIARGGLSVRTNLSAIHTTAGKIAIECSQ